MGKRSVNAEDIFRIALVGDAVMHPDGRMAAVTVTRINSEENCYQTHIWLVQTSSGECTPFTVSEKSESAPQWSPDGKWIAFLSTRVQDKQQVFAMPVQGGEAHQVTRAQEGVQSFRWSPDGRSIAYVANVAEWAKDEKPREKDVKPTPREKFTEDVKIIRRTWYKSDGVGFFGEKRNHLHVVNVGPVITPWKPADSTRVAPTGGVEQLPVCRLTEGPFDVDTFDWAPDGSWLVFSANLLENSDETLHRHLYRLPVMVPQKDTDFLSPVATADRLFDMPCLAENPRFSPGGDFIAFYGSNMEDAFYSQNQVWVYHVATGETRCLTRAFDETFGDASLTDTRASSSASLCWSEHSRYVYTLLSHRGTTQLVRIHCRSGEMERLTHGQHCILTYSLNRRASTVAIVKATPLDPCNVFLMELPAPGEAATQRRLTQWNADWLAEVELAVPQRFTFTSDGIDMDGWVMLPPGNSTGEPIPVVVQVHGGPMAMYADNFFLEFQLIAARGMAVVYGNPRGSLGYGQAFCASIRGDWGNLDFRDVENCVDAALAKYPLDPHRVAIAGGSYGGFMSAWAIGHSDRYKAAVVMRAVINEYSMFGTCDVGYLDQLDFGCKPWENHEPYFRVSPIASAHNIKANVLIIHSENDLRCPVEQAEQLYAALRAHRVPVEFLRFPGESHGLSRNGQPWHRVFRLEKIQSFLAAQLAAHLS